MKTAGADVAAPLRHLLSVRQARASLAPSVQLLFPRVPLTCCWLGLLLLCCLLGACASRDGTAVAGVMAQWPQEMPAARNFQRVWQRDPANRRAQDEADYLQWVQRFYEGSNLVPGWLSVSSQVMERLSPAEQASILQPLQQLGIMIGSEWAKDNAVRRIDTRMVAVWRDALLESLRREELQDYLQVVTRDVEALLAGRLSASAVSFERYYIDEFDF